MFDYLSFRKLISIEVLIALYYFGAIVMPLLFIIGMIRLRRKLQLYALEDKVYSAWLLMLESFNIRTWKWLLFGVAMFLFAELMWRLLFEFLIAFMQMRDAIVVGSGL